MSLVLRRPPGKDGPVEEKILQEPAEPEEPEEEEVAEPEEEAEPDNVHEVVVYHGNEMQVVRFKNLPAKAEE